MVCFFPNGKKGILFSFTKRAISRTIKTVAHFLYLRFVVKYLKELFLTKCLTISSLINSYLNTSPVSKPGDSCINQLLSITHKIFISLDKEIEVRRLLLGISKAFCSRIETRQQFRWTLSHLIWFFKQNETKAWD